MAYIESLKTLPIAMNTADANEQVRSPAALGLHLAQAPNDVSGAFFPPVAEWRLANCVQCAK